MWIEFVLQRHLCYKRTPFGNWIFIYTLCLKTIYVLLRDLQKNTIMLWYNHARIFLWYAVEINGVQTILKTVWSDELWPMHESLRETPYYDQANHPRHRLVTKGNACLMMLERVVIYCKSYRISFTRSKWIQAESSSWSQDE